MAISWIYVGLLLALFLFLVVCFFMGNPEYKETYAAWVKYTGNPKELTYDEWRMLMNSDLISKIDNSKE